MTPNHLKIMMTLQEKITTHLTQITAPTLGLNLGEMGFKTNIDLQDALCSIELIAGFPIKLLPENLQSIIQDNLKKAFPSLQFEIAIEQFIKAHRTQLVGKGLRVVKNTIAIASGKGGVGKSTVTVNLAITLARAGARVGILDADIYGPSIPMMLGHSQPVTLKGEHYLPATAHGIQAMSIAYLTDAEEALIWRGPMLAKSLLQMLDITLWDDLDYLFIDLPPGTGDIQLSLVQKIPLTTAIVVTTPQNIATLDAQKAIKMFVRTGIDVLGVIENMATHTCSHCQHTESIFGEGGAIRLCNQFQVPLLGQLPLNRSVREGADEGQPVVVLTNNDISKPWLAAAIKTAIALAQKPINYVDKFPPIVEVPQR